MTDRVWATLLEGLRYTGTICRCALFTIMIAFLSLFFRGPFMVGIPAFAEAMLPEGAAGFEHSHVCPGCRLHHRHHTGRGNQSSPPLAAGLILLLDFFGFGCVFLFMVQVPDTWLIAMVVLVSAVVDGYVIILITTWIQRQVAKEKLGRVMSVIMLASQGLFPISAAAAGALAAWSIGGMLTARWVMIGITLAGLLLPGVRHMGHRQS